MRATNNEAATRQNRLRTLLSLVFGVVFACIEVLSAYPQNSVNPDAAVIQNFQDRVAAYLRLRKSAEAALAPLKKPTESQARIEHHKGKLRNAIVDRRRDAVQGDVFTPAISAEFRRLIQLAYQADGGHIRQSLHSSEPATRTLHVRINERYPTAPLQTMPPSLLLNLPPLPPELEYRLVGRDLILRDIGANLIVDIVAAVIPQ
jgi:hypothetical protein